MKRNMFYILTLTAATLLMQSCGGQNFGMADEARTFGSVVSYNTEVDVLLVVDTSPSMAKHHQALANQMPALVNALNATKLDYHIAVTTMDLGSGGAKGVFIGSPGTLTISTPNLGQVLTDRLMGLGENGGLEQGLGAMRASLTSTNPVNAGFSRANSMLAVLFMSNEDDHSATTDYEAFLNSLKPTLPTGDRSWVVSFIGVLPNDTSCQTSDWGYFQPGTHYKALADLSGGRSENICTGSLAPAVSNFRARIMEIITEYKLGDRAVDPASIRVYLNGQLVAENPDNGWTYNETRNSITFHGTAIPVVGSSIHVDFTPKEIK